MPTAVFILALLLRLAGAPVAVPFRCPPSAPAQVAFKCDLLGHLSAIATVHLLPTSATPSRHGPRVPGGQARSVSLLTIRHKDSPAPTSPLRAKAAPTGNCGLALAGNPATSTPASRHLSRGTGATSTLSAPPSFHTERQRHAAVPPCSATPPRSLPTAASNVRVAHAMHFLPRSAPSCPGCVTTGSKPLFILTAPSTTAPCSTTPAALYLLPRATRELPVTHFLPLRTTPPAPTGLHPPHR